jgi:hypothetical protein
MFWQQWFNLNTTHGVGAFFQGLVADTWFNILASIICGVAVYFVVLKKMIMCKETWCFRLGHHPVHGTHYKTCPKHTNAKIHRKWQAHHKAHHPEAHKFLNK